MHDLLVCKTPPMDYCSTSNEPVELVHERVKFDLWKKALVITRLDVEEIQFMMGGPGVKLWNREDFWPALARVLHNVIAIWRKAAAMNATISGEKCPPLLERLAREVMEMQFDLAKPAEVDYVHCDQVFVVSQREWRGTPG